MSGVNLLETRQEEGFGGGGGVEVERNAGKELCSFEMLLLFFPKGQSGEERGRIGVGLVQ